MSRRPPPPTVAVVLFDRGPVFESAVPISVFGLDRSASGVPRFDLRVVAAEPGPFRSTAGVTIDAPHSLDALAGADLVIVPTWRDPAEVPPQDAVVAIRRAHDAGATVVGLCLGAFVVAAAGLLDGRRAATHWYYADALAAMYPSVDVDASVLFVDLGDVLTSAGTAAGIDACLHLVRRFCGADAAATIARRMVVPPQRSGGQAQYIRHRAAPAPRATPLAAVLDDALRRLDQAIDVDDLAARAGMSRRTFDRRFREETGASPLQWLLHQRIARAQHLLEQTDLPVDAVARRAGFSTAVALRPHFRRIVGVPPQAYRETFAGGRSPAG